MRVQYGAGLVLVIAACAFDESGLPASADGGAIDPAVDAAGPDAAPVADAMPDGPPDARWPQCMSDSQYVGRQGSPHRYRPRTETVSFGAAADACDDDEAYLVVIEDAAEDTWIRGLQGGNQWIGLDDREDEGVYRWANGVILQRGVDYENWNTTEPNNFFGEDCIEMRGDGRWNDETCDATRRYVCECDPGWSPGDNDDG